MVAKETSGQKAIRQSYQGEVGERLLQAGQMGQDRAMMRRGAQKQQDGTLGQPGTKTLDDEMNIRVGDEVHYHHPPPATASPPALVRTLAKVGLVAALMAGSGGLGATLAGLLSGGNTEPPPADAVDNDTKYEGGISVE